MTANGTIIRRDWLDIGFGVRAQRDEWSVSFGVRQVLSYEDPPTFFKDGDGVSFEQAPDYVSGTIKWDGCSHVCFGEAYEDGYVHICGGKGWEAHAEMMRRVFALAREMMPERAGSMG